MEYTMANGHIQKSEAGVVVTAVADEPLALLLGQTGIHVDQPKDMRDAEACIEALCERKVGIIIVQEDYQERFSERFKERLARRKGLPILLYCPSFDSETQDMDSYIAEVIRPAIGYEIRLD